VRSNVSVIVVASAFFGVAAGMYEFIFPFYLEERHLSFQDMGIIFSLGTGVMVLLRVFFGGLSDIWGRKLLYSLSLGLCSLGMGLNAFFSSIWPLTVLRTVRDGANQVREVIHPILLYENVHRGFINLIGKARGLEFLFMALGTSLAGMSFHAWGNPGSLKAAGLILLGGLLVFAPIYRERREGGRSERPSLRRFFSFKVRRELMVVAWSGFILTVGGSASHSFIMPLYFTHKFGASIYAVRWLMVMHRLSIVVPMMLFGVLKIRDLRRAYMAAVFGEGLVLVATTLMPNFVCSAAVWLLHDFLCAGIWLPIQYTLIQHYARDESRGLDVSSAMGIISAGGIVGPYLAGRTAPVLIDLPFALAGVLMVISVLPMFALGERSKQAPGGALSG